jgi:hypothetical protein
MGHPSQPFLFGVSHCHHGSQETGVDSANSFSSRITGYTGFEIRFETRPLALRALPEACKRLMGHEFLHD